MDGRVHCGVLMSFVRRGYAPDVAELAAELALAPHEIEAALRRLHDGHGLVLHPDSCQVWVAHPFSSSPTAVWVDCGGRGFWAPCLWCAAGIVALVAPNATIHTRYAGEHEEVKIEVRDGRSAADLQVHFAIPPRDAWANVVHWCSTVLPFRRAEDVDEFSERHRLPRGAIVPWSQVLELGHAWYHRHLAEDWSKWTQREAQAIFEHIGLTDDFWRLPPADVPF